jgi:hypothetical protein
VSKVLPMRPSMKAAGFVATVAVAGMAFGCGAKPGASPATGGAGATVETGGTSGSGGAAAGGAGGSAGARAATPTEAERAAAATATANGSASCTAIHPFYWEIGDRTHVMVSGTASAVGATAPGADTQMLIASASKWIFGAYVVERRGGALSANDVAALTMRTGYSGLRYGSCIKLLRVNQDAETVHDCFVAANLTGNNADLKAADVGKFSYNGGHFQWLADGELGLGETNNASLRAALAAELGADVSFTYDSPQLAAGIQTSGRDYGVFLRKILNRQLRIGDLLGTQAVCTNPATCPEATYTPIPGGESWHYSLGHWVEDDPVAGDGAFSSPGAFGFYPWIDAGKTTYGLLARRVSVDLTASDPVGVESVTCGRLIRKAWFTAAAQ